MSGKENTFKSIALVFWSVLMTAFTLVLGAVPMKALRRALGRGPFWLLALGLGLSFWGMGWVTLATAVVALAVLVGSYTELELKKFSVPVSGAVALGVSTGAVGALFWVWTRQAGPNWYQEIIATTQSMIDRVVMSTATSAEALKAESIIAQAPSGVLIVLCVALALSLIFEKKLLSWLGTVTYRRESLTNFRVPDIMIWVFIGSLLGSFLETQYPTVKLISTNLFNIAILLYFFQGLAVVARFFDVNKVGLIWRAVIYTLIVLQLFLAVSFIGIMDYWLDFRTRITKKAARLNKRA